MNIRLTAALALSAAMLTGCPKKGPTASAEELAANPVANFQEGIRALEADRKGNVDYATAYEYFRKSAEDLDGGEKAHFNAGWTAERMNNLPKAEEHYRAAFEADMDYGPAMYSLVRVMRANGKAEAVPAVYESFLEAHPDNAQVRTEYMDALVAAGRPGEAIAQGQAVLRKDPSNDAVYRSLSGLYLKQGKLEMARIMGDKALELNDADPDVYNNMGVVMLQQEDSPGAIEKFKMALKLDSTHYEANMNLGLLVLDSGDYNLALNSFDKALERNPSSVDARIGRAVALRGQGDYTEAGKIYDDLIKANPKLDVAYFNAATLHEKYTRQFPKAIKYLEAYKDAHSGEISPNDPVFQRIDRIAAAQAEEERRKQEELERKKAEEERKKRAREALAAMEEKVIATQARLDEGAGCLPEEISMEIGMVLETAVDVISTEDVDMSSEVNQMLDDYYLPMLDEAEATACAGGGAAAPEGEMSEDGAEGEMSEDGAEGEMPEGEMSEGDDATDDSAEDSADETGAEESDAE